MKHVRVEVGLIPLDQFKARAPEVLAELVESGHPLILTRRGRAAAVLIPPRTYDAMVKRLRVLDDLGDRLADQEAAKLRDHFEMRKRLRSWRDRMSGHTKPLTEEPD
jgi:prevent-host-death family protein